MNLFDILTAQAAALSGAFQALATAQRNFTDSLSTEAIQDLPNYAQALLAAIQATNVAMDHGRSVLSVVQSIADDGAAAISKAVDLAAQLPPA